MRHRDRAARHEKNLARIASRTRPDPQRPNRKPPPVVSKRRVRMIRRQQTVENEAKIDSHEAIKVSARSTDVGTVPKKKKGIAARMIGGAKRLFGMNRARGG